jgi:hypothetical protein
MNKNLFLTVLDAGKLKMEGPASANGLLAALSHPRTEGRRERERERKKRGQDFPSDNKPTPMMRA